MKLKQSITTSDNIQNSEEACILKETFVKYVGCFRDSVYQQPVHLQNSYIKRCLNFKYLTLLHHVNCA